MKKITILLTILCLALIPLTACGESDPLLTAADYELDPASKTTNRNVAIGDNSETFLAAYGEYKIFTSIENGDYQVIPTEEIPFGSAVTLLLPTFFIDGAPTDLDQFCEENEIAKEDLTATLSSDGFLQSHTAVYHYLVFTWENGAITDIRSEYMDYNEDAVYYDELYNVQ